MAATSASVLARQPLEPVHIMPTALGNVLRRHEQIAGASVGLPILSWATHIGLVADPAHTKYVNDQRTLVDLAARMSATAAAAAAVSFVLLWDKGAALLLVLVPYVVSWLSFRGAVVCANAYGAALQAWVNLNRFELYDALRLKPVDTLEEERTRNMGLRGILTGRAIDLELKLEPDAVPAEVGSEA